MQPVILSTIKKHFRVDENISMILNTKGSGGLLGLFGLIRKQEHNIQKAELRKSD